MPKGRKKVKSTGPKDRFYQEWHINRKPTGASTPEEFVLDCPRPLLSRPAGRYWAIEIHSIEARVPHNRPTEQVLLHEHEHFCLTTDHRTGKTPFLTGPGDPTNIWYLHRYSDLPACPALTAVYETEETRLHDKALYTDDLGHGKLIIGDHIYMQYDGAQTGAHHPSISMAIEYTYTTISCNELVEELNSFVSEA